MVEIPQKRALDELPEDDEDPITAQQTDRKMIKTDDIKVDIKTEGESRFPPTQSVTRLLSNFGGKQNMTICGLFLCFVFILAIMASTNSTQESQNQLIQE